MHQSGVSPPKGYPCMFFFVSYGEWLYNILESGLSKYVIGALWRRLKGINFAVFPKIIGLKILNGCNHELQTDLNQELSIGKNPQPLQHIWSLLLGGQHKEGRSRGTGHDPTSLEHRKGEGRITVDVVLNIEI